MRISIKRRLAVRLAVAVGFAAAQAILAITALATPRPTSTIPPGQRLVLTVPITVAGAIRPPAMRRTQQPS